MSIQRIAAWLLLFSVATGIASMGGSYATPADLIIDFRNNLIYNSGGQTNLGSARRNVINKEYINSLVENAL